MYRFSAVNKAQEKMIIQSEELEKKRKQLFFTARMYGMSAEETLQCSRELDHMIVEIQSAHIPFA
ncbi:aspartyl-phosphate phosphatase Spo0E family protein [Sporolactobacillus pectinivorans]|uniref:aspartyl-phosphate phosphatase Spo0E family protein n=1 Tax=Sporolactobacillus pectinivorans TaxID=1591408 RepID=UPI000C2619E4|nr:aspartyl-phosphate phosphatase Spo0E family protein [Sporolactobacillus pectinivorans]